MLYYTVSDLVSVFQADDGYHDVSSIQFHKLAEEIQMMLSVLLVGHIHDLVLMYSNLVEQSADQNPLSPQAYSIVVHSPSRGQAEFHCLFESDVFLLMKFHCLS